MKDDRLASFLWPPAVALIIGATQWLLLVFIEQDEAEFGVVTVAALGGLLLAEGSVNIVRGAELYGRSLLRVALFFLILFVFASSLAAVYLNTKPDRQLPSYVAYLIWIGFPIVGAVRAIDWKHVNERTLASELEQVWERFTALFRAA